MLRDAGEPTEIVCGVMVVTCPRRITCMPYRIAELDWHFAFSICRNKLGDSNSYVIVIITEDFVWERIQSERRGG